MFNYFKKKLYYKNHIVRLSKFKNNLPKKKNLKSKKNFLLLRETMERYVF